VRGRRTLIREVSAPLGLATENHDGQVKGRRVVRAVEVNATRNETYFAERQDHLMPNLVSSSRRQNHHSDDCVFPSFGESFPNPLCRVDKGRVTEADMAFPRMLESIGLRSEEYRQEGVLRAGCDIAAKSKLGIQRIEDGFWGPPVLTPMVLTGRTTWPFRSARFSLPHLV